VKKSLLILFFLLGLLPCALAQNFNMGNLGTINNACGGNFFDSGGNLLNYGNSQNFTATFCAPAGQYLSFNFTAFNLENGWDFLDIYNGPTVGAPLLGSYTGTGGPGIITSTQGGCLTFVFSSDNSFVFSGWAATITCSTTPPSTGNDCGSSLPFCTGVAYSFPNNTNQPDLGPIDCLLSTPNPIWYYMQIQNPGNLNINIQQTDLFGFGIDVDFDLWGPFTSLADGCADIAAGTAPSIDCSFSPAFIEQANIVGALTGQFYILLLTNFSNVAGTINFSTAAGSTATTNCALLCNITDVTATPTACVPATNNYTLNGQIIVANPPTTGNLIVSSSCGGSTTINAPFVSPINYSIPGIISTGGICNVTASFSADPSCTFTQSYTAPASCGSGGLNCPAYANVSTSPNNACAGQVYYFDVANTACNGTITMNVIGNYGSQFANEITWTLTSNLTGNVLASGGPGINGAAVNVLVGPLNPAIFGNIFTLTVYDSWGDGFNGVGGFMSVQQNGIVIGGPILPGFWANSSTIFGANIAISPAVITITTPTGPVTSTVTGCNNFHVPLTFQNTNFCNTINISLPFTITCVSTGAIISSGTKNVTVYPSIPTSASDLVSIVFNPATCTWSMTPENDCIAANIGNIFTVSPDPSTLTAAACTGGGETFTVAYNGVLGGPNCCSTGGPLIPITYSQSFTQSTVTAVNSPFGGTNNAALLTIPPNSVGGNATSLNFTLNIAGYCFNAAATSYWVTIIVDGNIVSDVWYNPALVNNTINLNLAGIPNGYNQNSVIQVYIYPNQLAPATYIPNGICGSLAPSRWTANVSGTINATFSDMAPTPGVCTFNPFLVYNCCNSTVVPDNLATICSGGSLSSLTTWQAAVIAANTNCIVYSSLTPVAGSVLPDNLLPNGINASAIPIQQIVGAYYYCDIDGSGTVNTGDTYTLISTFTLTVNPLPTATISGSISICSGGTTNITFTGTPNATITYTINGGANQTIVLNGAGTATLATGVLLGTATYALVSAAISGPPLCTQAIVGSAVATIIPAPIASFTYATPFCVTGVDPFPTFTGGGVAGVFSSTAGLVFVSTATGQIDLSASTPGTYIVTNTIAAAGGCPAVSATFSVVISVASISNVFHD
jgi:hypothetical protein